MGTAVTKVYGLNALQTLVMNVYCNPSILLSNSRYGNVLSMNNVADFLGVELKKVQAAVNDDLFIRAMYDQTTLNLRMKKAMVDQTLIEAACDPNPKHSADRKLFYQLIGAMDDRGEGPKKDTLSREQKLAAITKVLGVVNKANYQKEITDARPKRPGPGPDSKPGRVQEGAEGVPEPKTDREDGDGGQPSGVPTVSPDVPLAVDRPEDI